MINNVWDENAPYRHKQILGGRDISFSKLLSPLIVHLIETIPNAGISNLLDAGCGTGILTLLLSTKVRRVVGLDSSIKSIEIAEKYCGAVKNVTFVCAPIENYDAKEKFDITVSNMTLQTIEPLGNALHALSKVLVKNGVLIFSIPHPCFWQFHKPDIFSQQYTYSKNSSHTIPFQISNDPDPLPHPIPYHHRSLEAYSNRLYDAGFCINKILEPLPDENVQQEYQSKWNYPRFMIFLCSKFSPE